MCSTCGCGTDEVRITGDPAEQHDHNHPHDHPHDHEGRPRTHAHTHAPDRTHTLELEQAVLGRNDHIAGHNRDWLVARGILALNVMSSPGAGKTTLLERTIAHCDRKVSVIEGDQETLFDADRIRAAGARAVQVNTGAGCHLDAGMVERALAELGPEPDSLVFFENVGNLVCPALFDLGEAAKVVVISVPEGDDKPLKYPHMFAAADLVVVNKIDLLPYVDFDIDRLIRDARKLNPTIQVLPMSVRTGEGFEAWLGWLNTI